MDEVKGQEREFVTERGALAFYGLAILSFAVLSLWFGYSHVPGTSGRLGWLFGLVEADYRSYLWYSISVLFLYTAIKYGVRYFQEPERITVGVKGILYNRFGQKMIEWSDIDALDIRRRRINFFKTVVTGVTLTIRNPQKYWDIIQTSPSRRYFRPETIHLPVDRILGHSAAIASAAEDYFWRTKLISANPDLKQEIWLLPERTVESVRQGDVSVQAAVDSYKARQQVSAASIKAALQSKASEDFVYPLTPLPDVGSRHYGRRKGARSN